MKLHVREFTMAYEDTGRGPAILFIHGYPLGRRIWDPQLRDLLGSARLLAPDLRGHGDSEATPGPYTMEMLADDCMALLEAREVTEPVIVCGLSMGGYVTLQIVRKFPERVAAVVLAATRASADSPEGRAARDADIALVRAEGVEAVIEKMLPRLLSPATLQRKPKVVELVRRTMSKTSVQGVIGDLEGMKERPDMLAELGRIDKPALVIHGRADTLIPLAEAEALRDAVPGASLEVLDDAAHLVNVEQPTKFNEAVLAFQRRVWAH